MNLIASENQIQADVDSLKTRFSNTQELYREVATLLFFRYGITPTANKLYQHVRKGSMTAPAEALNRFWTDLRAKSRVRIEAPDLPEELAVHAGTLVATLWDQAQNQAKEFLENIRNGIEEQLIAVRVERDSAVAAETAGQAALGDLIQANARLEERFAAATNAKLALETRLAASEEERDRLELALRGARESFGQELEKIRNSLHAVEARSEAEIKRALLEIDRGRTLANKITKELTAARSSMAKQQAADKAATAKLQSQVSSLREASGTLKGELAQARTQLAETKKELALANAELIKAAPTLKPKAATTKSKGSKSLRR